MEGEFRLTDMRSDHSVDTSLFLPFTVARLLRSGAETHAALTIKFFDILGPGLVTDRLNIHWDSGQIHRTAFPVSERTITEWGACGIACVLLSAYTDLRLTAVGLDGDRFDYWVSDGENDFGLEVSGTTVEDLETRHRFKVRQLLGNPHGVDGYVVVVDFSAREAVFSFNRFEAD